ncbi:MAG: PBSX family phage terminase large subunit [Pseudomonadota bacterium]
MRVKWAKAFQPLTEPKRYKGARGGRGSGKTRFFADLFVLDMFRHNMGGVCLRETQNSIQDSSKAEIERAIERMKLPGFRVKEAEIITPHGQSILFRGMQNHTAARIKSLSGMGRAWFDEAQAASKRSLSVLTPTIRMPGSEIWFSWNPESEGDPVEELFRDHADEATCVTVNWDGNPWFPDELRREMERDKRRDPDKHAHVWDGMYRQQSEAQVFRNWSIKAFETPSDASFYLGADWGFATDPTVAVRCFIHGETLMIDHEAHGVGVDIDLTPALFDQIPEARRWVITADSARPETISYMKRQGFRIRGAKKGKGSVEDGVEFLKSFDIVVHPRCQQTIRELREFSFRIDRHTNEIIPCLEDANNHCIDALRYATERIRRRATKTDTAAA